MYVKLREHEIACGLLITSPCMYFSIRNMKVSNFIS